MFPSLFWILVAVSAALCCVGFYQFVWFMSVGYGLAVAGNGLVYLIASLVRGENISIAYLLACVVMIVYGCRLGLFLLIRELKNAVYKKTLDAQVKPVPVPVQILMWILMALLYPIQTSPMLYRLTNSKLTDTDICLWIGLALMLIGVVLEALADKQKSASKKVNPHMAAMNGLYQYCRCPNYFGEVVFWTGVFVTGLNIVSGLQWIIVLLGYICILWVMVSGAKRLQKRQDHNYGDKEEYRTYVSKTPLLLPFLPIYHPVKEEK